MPAGRPLKFGSVEEINPLIDEYFEKTPISEWTITGLALALDTSRKTLVEYEGKDKFSNTIKKAKEKVEMSYELDLKKHGRSGTIFALKNFDWKDKTETDITTKGEALKGFNYLPPDTNHKATTETTPSVPEATGRED